MHEFRLSIDGADTEVVRSAFLPREGDILYQDDHSAEVVQVYFSRSGDELTAIVDAETFPDGDE